MGNPAAADLDNAQWFCGFGGLGRGHGFGGQDRGESDGRSRSGSATEELPTADLMFGWIGYHDELMY